MTILPNVTAQTSGQSTYNDIPNAVSPQISLLLEETQHHVREMLKPHPGWIGIVGWENGKVSVLYVGDPQKSPYNPRNIHNKSTAGPLLASCSTSIVQAWGIPSNYTYSGTSYTTAYHVQQKLNSLQSPNSKVDLLQNLNTFSATKSQFMQIAIMYDAADCISSSPAWWINLASINTSTGGNSNSTFPENIAITSGSNDVIYEDAYANSGSDYEQCLTDSTKSTGKCLDITYPGDSYNYLSLGSQNIGSQAGHAGPLMEELDTDGTSTWHWNTASKNTLDFQQNPNGGIVTSCNGWSTILNPSTITKTTSTSPCYVTFDY